MLQKRCAYGRSASEDHAGAPLRGEHLLGCVLTTVGVKIDKKIVTVGAEAVTLVLWDIAGEDDTRSIRELRPRGVGILPGRGRHARQRPSRSRARSRRG
jgi:hypothetical protein